MTFLGAPRTVRMALLVFFAIMLSSGIPGLEAVLAKVGLGRSIQEVLFPILGLMLLVSLVVALVGTVAHYRQNGQLTPRQKTMWYPIIWIPGLGALAYYWRVMRHDRAPN